MRVFASSVPPRGYQVDPDFGNERFLSGGASWITSAGGDYYHSHSYSILSEFSNQPDQADAGSNDYGVVAHRHYITGTTPSSGTYNCPPYVDLMVIGLKEKHYSISGGSDEVTLTCQEEDCGAHSTGCNDVTNLCECEVNWGPIGACDDCLLLAERYDQSLCDYSCAVNKYGADCSCGIDCDTLLHSTSCVAGNCNCIQNWGPLNDCSVCQLDEQYFSTVSCDGTCSGNWEPFNDCSNCALNSNYDQSNCDYNTCASGQYGADCSCTVDCNTLLFGTTYCVSGTCECEQYYGPPDLCDSCQLDPFHFDTTSCDGSCTGFWSPGGGDCSVCLLGSQFDQSTCDVFTCATGRYPPGDCSCTVDCSSLPESTGCMAGICQCSPNYGPENLCDTCMLGARFDPACNGECIGWWGPGGGDCSTCQLTDDFDQGSCDATTCAPGRYPSGDCSCTTNCAGLPHSIGCDTGVCLCDLPKWGPPDDCSVCQLDPTKYSVVLCTGVDCVGNWGGSGDCEECQLSQEYNQTTCKLDGDCADGYYGADCSCTVYCDSLVHSTGCVSGTCECEVNWGGPNDCSVCQLDSEYSQVICDGVSCASGRYGPDCSCTTDCDTLIHSTGCVAGSCECETNWGDPDFCDTCQLDPVKYNIVLCNGVDCVGNWGGSGDCETCQLSPDFDQIACDGVSCAAGNFGTDCSCSVDCNSLAHPATCVSGSCECQLYWGLPDVCDTCSLDIAHYEVVSCNGDCIGWWGPGSGDCSVCQLGSEFDQAQCDGVTCSSGRYGPDCSCNVDCSVDLPHSTGCVSGICQCQIYWTPENQCDSCSLSASRFDVVSCNGSCIGWWGPGAGDCSTCQLSADFDQVLCDDSTCAPGHFPPGDCSCTTNCAGLAHSIGCESGVCLCDLPNWGPANDCSVCQLDPAKYDVASCNGNCNSVGWWGPGSGDCEVCQLPSEYNQTACDGVACNSGRYGSDCSCMVDCVSLDHSTGCSGGVCECVDNWGDLNDCSVCQLDAQFDQSLCDWTCDGGNFGPDCSCVVNCAQLPRALNCTSGTCLCEPNWGDPDVCDTCSLLASNHFDDLACDGTCASNWGPGNYDCSVCQLEPQYDQDLCDYTCEANLYGGDCSCSTNCSTLPLSTGSCVSGNCECNAYYGPLNDCNSCQLDSTHFDTVSCNGDCVGNWSPGSGDCSICLLGSQFHQILCDGVTCAVGRFGADCSCTVNCSSLLHSTECVSGICECETYWGPENQCDSCSLSSSRFDVVSCNGSCIGWWGPGAGDCSTCQLSADFDQVLCDASTCAPGHFPSGDCSCTTNCAGLPHSIGCDSGICLCNLPNWGPPDDCSLCQLDPVKYNVGFCNGDCVGNFGPGGGNCEICMLDPEYYDQLLCDYTCDSGRFGTNCTCTVNCTSLDYSTGYCNNGVCECETNWGLPNDCSVCQLDPVFNQDLCDGVTCATGQFGADCTCSTDCDTLPHSIGCSAGTCECAIDWETPNVCDSCSLISPNFNVETCNGSCGELWGPGNYDCSSCLLTDEYDQSLCNGTCATGHFGSDCSCETDCSTLHPLSTGCVSGNCECVQYRGPLDDCSLCLLDPFYFDTIVCDGISCIGNWGGVDCSVCLLGSQYNQSLCDYATCAAGRFGSDCSCSTDCDSLAHSSGCVFGTCECEDYWTPFDVCDSCGKSPTRFNVSTCDGTCVGNWGIFDICSTCQLSDEYYDQIACDYTCASGRFGSDCSCQTKCDNLPLSVGCVSGECLCETNFGPVDDCSNCILSDHFDLSFCNGTCSGFWSPPGDCSGCTLLARYDQDLCDYTCAENQYGPDCTCTVDCSHLPLSTGCESGECQCQIYYGPLNDCNSCQLDPFHFSAECDGSCIGWWGPGGGDCSNCTLNTNFDQTVCETSTCADGRFGTDCSCVVDCSTIVPFGTGECVNGICTCETNYGPPNVCDSCVLSVGYDFDLCDGQTCDSGYFGNDCSCTQNCTTLPLSTGCSSGSCVCIGYWGGDLCDTCSVSFDDNFDEILCDGSCIDNRGPIGDCSVCSLGPEFDQSLCNYTCAANQYGSDCSCGIDCDSLSHSSGSGCIFGNCYCEIYWGPVNDCSVCELDASRNFNTVLCDTSCIDFWSPPGDCSSCSLQGNFNALLCDGTCEEFFSPPGICTNCSLPTTSNGVYFDVHKCNGECSGHWGPPGDCSVCQLDDTLFDQLSCDYSCAAGGFGLDCSCDTNCATLPNSVGCQNGSCVCEGYWFPEDDCSDCSLSEEDHFDDRLCDRTCAPPNLWGPIAVDDCSKCLLDPVLFNLTKCDYTCSDDRFGRDCSCTVDCKLLENGNGFCDGGECQCVDFWSGSSCKTCDLPGTPFHYDLDQCDKSCAALWGGPECKDCPLDLNFHQGACDGITCSEGLYGEDCTCSVDCSEIRSTGCVDGVCVCEDGFAPTNVCECTFSDFWFDQDLCSGACIRGHFGDDCSCTENCDAKNGYWECVTGQCICQNGWGGKVCRKPLCRPPCMNGNCTAPNGNECICTEGWIGKQCNVEKEVVEKVAKAAGFSVGSIIIIILAVLLVLLFIAAISSLTIAIAERKRRLRRKRINEQLDKGSESALELYARYSESVTMNTNTEDTEPKPEEEEEEEAEGWRKAVIQQQVVTSEASEKFGSYKKDIELKEKSVEPSLALMNVDVQRMLMKSRRLLSEGGEGHSASDDDDDE